MTTDPGPSRFMHDVERVSGEARNLLKTRPRQPSVRKLATAALGTSCEDAVEWDGVLYSARAAALLPGTRITAARVRARPGRRRHLARVRAVAAEMLRASRLGLRLRLGRFRRRCFLRCRHAVRVALLRDEPVPSLSLDREGGRCPRRVYASGRRDGSNPFADYLTVAVWRGSSITGGRRLPRGACRSSTGPGQCMRRG
jgi:hypothetical protein